MKQDLLLDRLLLSLRSRGALSSSELTAVLGVSRSTLSRLVQLAGGRIVHLGQTRNRLYAVSKALSGIGSDLPIYEVQENGTLALRHRFRIFHQDFYGLDERVVSGLPAALGDMTPQGFMGRAFAQEHAQVLGVSSRTLDWSNDQILLALARRGEDLVGNLILGDESAQRWSQMEVVENSTTDLMSLSQRALQGLVAGSSAGGEQPKFTALVNGQHRIVKFSDRGVEGVQQRTSDLLICEFLALQILNTSPVAAASARLHVEEDRVFLEIQRFDRVGVRGRRAVLTLAAVDASVNLNVQSWSIAAEQLQSLGLLSGAEVKKVRFLEAFATLIGDSDRHFHNLVFYPEYESGSMILKSLRLAPAFDKLPMCFSAVAGHVVEFEFRRPLVPAYCRDEWASALKLARDYWDLVAADVRISPAFRQVARQCQSVLQT